MTALLRRLTGWYIASWVVLLWTVLVFCAGAATMFAAIVAFLPPQVRDLLL